MKPATPCRNLRTKKMFIPALAAETFGPENEEPGNSCHCWCNCTLTETGPDDRPVGIQVCTPERTCYES
jgi:hypothetical protein